MTDLEKATQEHRYWCKVRDADKARKFKDPKEKKITDTVNDMLVDYSALVVDVILARVAVENRTKVK